MGKLISLAEYAAKTGKDPGQPAPPCRGGRLPAQKIGKQWVIDEDAPLPPDKRVKSGDYRGWRDKYKAPSGKA